MNTFVFFSNLWLSAHNVSFPGPVHASHRHVTNITTHSWKAASFDSGKVLHILNLHVQKIHNKFNMSWPCLKSQVSCQQLYRHGSLWGKSFLDCRGLFLLQYHSWPQGKPFLMPHSCHIIVIVIASFPLVNRICLHIQVVFTTGMVEIFLKAPIYPACY